MVHNGLHAIVLDSRYVDCSESRDKAIYDAMFAGCSGDKLGYVGKCVNRATQDLLALFVYYVDIVNDHEPFFAGGVVLAEGTDVVTEEVYSILTDIVDRKDITLRNSYRSTDCFGNTGFSCPRWTN